jgi:ABC-type long-subunit fatty acid transport system fused permease/ATPase subunit
MFQSFTPPHRTIGKTAAWAAFFGLVVYAVTTILGLLSLKSPQDPIGDPYFTLMELLIVVIVPLMVVTMIAVERSLYHPHGEPPE